MPSIPHPSTSCFDRRRILVTGASSGIGRATARLLSQLGARVVVVGRDEARTHATLAALEGNGHRLELFDLSRFDHISAWLREISGTWGTLHGIVHAAGVHRFAPVRTVSDRMLRDCFEISVEAAIALVKGFRQPKVRAESGSVVLLSSAAALAARPGTSVYAASKGAVLSAARALAIELAPERIRVNTLAPGWVRTEMTDRIMTALAPDQIASIEAEHPLGIGLPEDVANAAAFLLSDSARWITGTTLVVDGGYTAS